MNRPVGRCVALECGKYHFTFETPDRKLRGNDHITCIRFIPTTQEMKLEMSVTLYELGHTHN
jgi:hypothetical protein